MTAFLAIPLFPESASDMAPRVDRLFWALTAFSVLLVIGIAGCIVWFAVRYRRNAPVNRSGPHGSSTPVELTWIIIPVFIALGMFTWGGIVYVDINSPPKSVPEIDVVGKQWMWKFQHPEGPREIDDLHLPVGRPVRLVMTSEDVIHSFFVPEFRVKKDVLPGRYTTIWFTPTKTGTYHLFCTQYCGTDHSVMRGFVYVLDPGDYQRWLASRGQTTAAPAASGRELFERHRCAYCHLDDAKGVGPSLLGVYGHAVKLNDGTTIVADENYLRDSILYPNNQVVDGYPNVMPTFLGQLTEPEVQELVTYVRSLGSARPAGDLTVAPTPGPGTRSPRAGFQRPAPTGPSTTLERATNGTARAAQDPLVRETNGGAK